MFLKCLCGISLDNICSPNDIEHLLISERSRELMESLVDEEVEKSGIINMWVEHWEDSQSIIVWKCHECGRLYLDAEGDSGNITVYKIEQRGIEPGSRTTNVCSVINHPQDVNSNTIQLRSVPWK